MKQFAPIDPLTIESDPRVVGSIENNTNIPGRMCLLIDGSHAIIFDYGYYTHPQTKESRWLTYQLEFPKAGLRWIVDALTIKFVKPPEEGGLPGGVFHYEEVVDGEELAINRAMGLGTNDNRQSGYIFKTLSRFDEYESVKNLSFTDAFLFDHGFLKLIEDTAERVERGEL